MVATHSAERFADLAVVDGHGLRNAFDEVAALDFHGERLVQRKRRADLDLDRFGGAFADQQIVLALEVLHDGVVHLIAGHAHGARIDDAGKRNDRDVGGAAADIDHHVAGRLGDGQTRADGGHHGLFHQMHLAGLGAIGGIDDGALFHLRDFAGHADHDARMHQHFAAVRLLNEVIQHALGDFEIGDDAVFHGPDGDDVARRAAQHLLGLFAHGFHFARVLVDGDNGGLVDDNAFALGKDQRIRGAEINGKIGREETEQRTVDSFCTIGHFGTGLTTGTGAVLPNGSTARLNASASQTSQETALCASASSAREEN